MQKLNNARRIALHWFQEYRHFRTDTYWRTRFDRRGAARFAWRETRELMYIDGGTVYWLPF